MTKLPYFLVILLTAALFFYLLYKTGKRLNRQLFIKKEDNRENEDRVQEHVFPWEPKPLSRTRKILLYSAVFFLFVIALFCVIFFLSFAVFIIVTIINNKIFTAPLRNRFYILLALDLLSAVLAYFFSKAFLYYNQILELNREEQQEHKIWGGKNSVLHLFNFRLRDFFDYSKINFRQGGMEVSGTLGPTILPLLNCLAVLNFLILLSGIRLKNNFLVYELISLPFIIFIYFMIGRKKSSIFVRPGNIAEAAAAGAVIMIKFNNPPVPRLKRISFFVPPHFRVSFFTRFNRTFPNTLPLEY